MFAVIFIDKWYTEIEQIECLEVFHTFEGATSFINANGMRWSNLAILEVKQGAIGVWGDSEQCSS